MKKRWTTEEVLDAILQREKTEEDATEEDDSEEAVSTDNQEESDEQFLPGSSEKMKCIWRGNHGGQEMGNSCGFPHMRQPCHSIHVQC